METKYNEILKYLNTGEHPPGYSKSQRQNFRKTSAKFTVKEGELFVGKRRAVKNEEEARQIFREFHASPMGGHTGINRTRLAVCSRFFWPGMTTDIDKWVHECDKCQRFGRPLSARKPLTCMKAEDMPRCVVKGCPQFRWRKKSTPGVTLHMFPKDETTIKKWLLQTKQDFGDLDLFALGILQGTTGILRICSAHFAPECYTLVGSQKVLLEDAIPTIFPERYKPPKKKKAAVTPVCKNLYMPKSVSTNDVSLVSNIASGDINQDNIMVTNDCGVNSDMSAAECRPEVCPSDPKSQPTDVGNSPYPSCENTNIPTDLPDVTITETSPVLPEWSSEKMQKAAQWPVYENNVEAESWKVMHDHLYRAPHSDNYQDPKRCSPTTEDIGSDDLGSYFEDTHSESELAEEMPKCFVKGCPSFSGRKKSTLEVTLHMFPKDLTTIKKWLLQTKQDFGDLDLFALGILQGTTGILRICSAHFAPECYTLVGSQKVLLEGAIPTIFPERDKPPKKKKAAVTPVCQNLYMPKILSTNDLSVVSNITSWGINQFLIPVIKINQDNIMVTNDCGVNSDMSAAECRPEVWPSDPRSQPTDVGNCPYPSCENTNLPTDLPEVTITETRPVLPEWSSEKMQKAAQWPVYENNVEAEPWKVMHDHFYRAPHSDNYQDPKRCSPTTEHIGSDGLGSYFEDTHSESELFSMLQNVANIFTMNKNKDLRSKRILNQALEIVSLIAGEEWVIEKKKSIHQGVHQLTGEFPVKCGDMAVYFTVDEWSYIDQHKEDYTDFVTDDVPMNRTLEVPKCGDSDPMTEADDMEDIPKKETSSDWEPDSKCDSEAEKEIDEEPSKSPERPYKCEKCEEAFLDSEALETHKITHVEKCKDCEEQFSSKAELLKHRAENHAVELYACTICGIQYDHKSQFIIHQWAHSGEKSFECKECGTKFGHRSSLLVHQRRDTEGKTFECSKCKKQFETRCEMTRHEKIHTKKKQFETRCEMIRHEKIHPKKKQYKCQKCGKTFTSKACYDKHKWSHVFLGQVTKGARRPIAMRSTTEKSSSAGNVGRGLY